MRRTVALITFFVLGLLTTTCGTDSEIDRDPIDTTTLNRNIAEVPLDQVFFDTFDGGSIPLSEATASDIARLLDRIPPIDDPRYDDPTDDPWLEPGDVVLGYVATDGQAYAYPHKILNFHEIVNDTLADVPVLVSYCPLCNSGVVYDRRLTDLRHDGVLTFGNTSALYDNDLVMVDRETTTYWWQVPGRAIVGNLSGATLTPLPSTTTTWEQWQLDHPDTLVLSRDLGFDRDYTRNPFTTYADRVNAGQTPFPVDQAALDDRRLDPAEQVVTIERGGEALAIPVAAVVDEIEVVVGGERYTVVADRAGGVSVFTLDDAGDRRPAASRSTFWFAYIAAFPEATVWVG